MIIGSDYTGSEILCMDFVEPYFAVGGYVETYAFLDSTATGYSSFSGGTSYPYVALHLYSLSNTYLELQWWKSFNIPNYKVCSVQVTPDKSCIVVHTCNDIS